MRTPNDSMTRTEWVPPHPHRFLYPVFSWPYKSLFQQPLSFHIYTKRGGVRGRPASNQNGKVSGRFPTRKREIYREVLGLPTASRLSTQPSEATNVFPPRCD